MEQFVHIHSFVIHVIFPQVKNCIILLNVQLFLSTHRTLSVFIWHNIIFRIIFVLRKWNRSQASLYNIIFSWIISLHFYIKKYYMILGKYLLKRKHFIIVSLFIFIPSVSLSMNSIIVSICFLAKPQSCRWTCPVVHVSCGLPVYDRQYTICC